MTKIGMLLALILATSACKTETDFGSCIGIGDTGNPEVVYRTSTRNLILAIIFSETIVVPAVIVFTNIRCPEALTNPKRSQE